MTFQTDLLSANVKESLCTKITTVCYIINDTYISYLPTYAVAVQYLYLVSNTCKMMRYSQ